MSLQASEGAAVWVPLLGPSLAEAARQTAFRVAESVQEPDYVARPPAGPAEAAAPGDVPWRDPSLAGGHAGIALFAAYLDRCAPGVGWDRMGHRHIRAAVRHPGRLAALDSSLHGGWGGLLFAADALAGVRPRYRTFLAQAEDAFVAGTRRLALHVAGAPPPLPPPTIDLISGLCGAVAALLTRRGRGAPDEALDQALRALVRAAGTADGLPFVAGPAGWHRSSDKESASSELNLGLSHGMPGMIAALALARLEGVEVEGLGEAVEEMVDRLRGYAYEDEFGPLWPLSVRLDGRPSPRPVPVQTAWCYGAPGCARALWLAGSALDRTAWTMEALDTIKAALRRPVERRRLGSPTFCHGQAGLTQIGLRFAADTGDRELTEALEDELARLVAGHDRAARFGYRRVDSLGRRRDSAGLLDGAAGVALVLLAAACEVEPRWDRAFLLS